jgi:hypothetical protein
MTTRRQAIIQLVLATAAIAGSVLSWLLARSTVQVAPISSGQPPTTSITFYAPLVVLALVLLTAAGVLTVLALHNLRGRDITADTANPWA